MDKWDESVNRIKQGMLAREPEAALAGALEMFANFGRCIELIATDTDRIATALEKQNAEISGEDSGISDEDSGIPSEPEHDL